MNRTHTNCALAAALGGLALAGSAAAIDPGLYAVGSNREFFHIDAATGAKTSLGFISDNAGTTGGLAYDAASDTLYLTSTSLDSVFTLDPDTLQATLIGSYGANVVMHGLEWNSATGTLYAASSTPNALYTVDTATGAATLVNDLGLTSFNNLGYDSINDRMYMTNSGQDAIYTLDLDTGVPTFLSVLGGDPASTNPNGLAFDPTTGTMYMVDNSQDHLYTIDLATGQATAVGPTGSGNLLGLVYIPTPGAAGLLAVAGLAAARRRR